MKKILKLVLLLTMISAYLVGCGDDDESYYTSITASEDEVIHLGDKNVEAQVIADNNITDGVITYGDVKDYSKITWEGDITGLKYFTGLRTLELKTYGDNTDYSELSSLEDLEELSLESWNESIDISPFGRGEILKLDLYIPFAEKLTGVQKLWRMEELILRLQNQDDLTFVDESNNLASIDRVTICQTSSDSITTLKGIENLGIIYELTLDRLNSLASLEGVSEQRQTLKKLSVQYTEQYRGTSPEPCIFSDISDVDRLYYLETFEILGNVTDIDLSPLSGNKNLQEIIVDLYYNTEVITVNGVFEKTYGLRRDIDITGLSDLPSLKKLHLSAHNITGANQIAKLNTIEDLYYRGNWDDLPDYYDFYKVIDSLPNLKTFGDGTNDLASMQAMINSYRNQGYLD